MFVLQWPCEPEVAERAACGRSGLPDGGRGPQRTLAPVECGAPPVQKKPCPCKKHPSCGQPKLDTTCMKYCQPPVPASYKPEKCYKPPDYKMESGTIYKLSYPGADPLPPTHMATPAVRPDNIQKSCVPFSQDTTFRLSYTGLPGERALPCRPSMGCSMLGRGPMQSVTTQRHDFTPKYLEERVPATPAPNNIHLSCAKMEENTTFRLSYQPVELPERIPSFKPEACYKKPEKKFEQDTVNKLSFQPWEVMPKEDYPWIRKPCYQQPVYAMENSTIYRASFLPNEGIPPPQSFKPCSQFKPSDRKFADETIYKESFQNAFVSHTPVQPIIKAENIQPSCMPMSQDTTFRLSYTGVEGERAFPYKPINRNMLGCGPMQSVTTQRHDYTRKPFVPTENFKPKPCVIQSDYKMDDTTTFRASYLPNEVSRRIPSFKPPEEYKKPAYILESDTINKLSYQPWEATPKEEYPWMRKPCYQQPAYCMEGTTIYRGSYNPPGNYVPDPNCTAPPSKDTCSCGCVGECNATDDL